MGNALSRDRLLSLGSLPCLAVTTVKLYTPLLESFLQIWSLSSVKDGKASKNVISDDDTENNSLFNTSTYNQIDGTIISYMNITDIKKDNTLGKD